MQVTTCGEIHKKNIYKKKEIVDFLSSEEEKIRSLIQKRCFHSNKMLIEDPVINYLNLEMSGHEKVALRSLIISTYYDCENAYPYLGDYFFQKFFKIKNTSGKNSKTFKYSKRDEKSVIESFKYESTKSIAKFMFDNVNLERSISVEQHLGSDIVVEFLNDMSFSVDYDFDYFRKFKNENFKNYKVIVIDGVIESVGEIHHLLHKANLSKIPYVIFCFGIHQEVKNVIIKNNSLDRFKVLPVVINAKNENSLNILNDLAQVHGVGVVSSLLGQTISQEVSKDLPVGNSIRFMPNKVSIDPVISKSKISDHRKFLKKRIDDALSKGNVNVDPIKNRLKSFSAKRLKVYIPNDISSDPNRMRELHYLFNFFTNIKFEMVRVKIFNEKIICFPEKYRHFVDNKIKSLREIYDRIEIVLL